MVNCWLEWKTPQEILPQRTAKGKPPEMSWQKSISSNLNLSFSDFLEPLELVPPGFSTKKIIEKNNFSIFSKKEISYSFSNKSSFCFISIFPHISGANWLREPATLENHQVYRPEFATFRVEDKDMTWRLESGPGATTAEPNKQQQKSIWGGPK